MLLDFSRLPLVVISVDALQEGKTQENVILSGDRSMIFSPPTSP